MKIKGFDKDLKCRGYQFEVGKEYKIETDKPLKLCTDTVFHYCNSLQQVHGYYNCCEDSQNRFCEIEVLGKEVCDDNKCGSNHIRIVREIVGDELKVLKGQINGNSGLFNTGNLNTGYYNTGDWNTGYYNTGNLNTGNYNTGDYNTGYYNTGNLNTGNRNTGDWNTGNRNTGYYNTGDWNTGDYNTGDWNTGDYNTGNYNTGDYNTGDYNTGGWNKSIGNNGFFNTVEPTVFIFNKDSGMTSQEFRNSKYYRALRYAPFILTEWVEYTEDEKKKDPKKKLIDGYLKKYSYKEACANWWEKTSEENRKIIKEIPNFDKEIFKEITGIDMDEENK